MTNSVHIVTLQGRRFASGLYWQPLTRPRVFQQEAREIGERDGFELATLRKGRLWQAGLAKASEVGTKSTYSLVSVVAAALGDDFIAVFEIDPGYYVLVACKGGGVIPDCDTHGDRDEIEGRLRHAYNQHNLSGRVICPAAFGFGGEDVELSSLIEPKKLRAEWQVRPLGRRITTRQALLAGAALFALGGGLFGYQAWQQQQEAERVALEAAAAEQQAAQTEAAGTATAAPPPPPLRHPWIDQPKPVDLVDACADAIDRTPLSLGGWMVGSANCDGSRLTAVYTRGTSAALGDLRQRAAQTGYAVENVSDDGETATLALELAKLAGGGDDQMLPLETPVELVRSILQRRRISHQLQAKAVPAPAPPTEQNGTNAPPAPVPDWRTVTVAITGRHSPIDAMRGFETLPGLRVTSIAVTRNASTLEWAINGEINGK